MEYRRPTILAIATTEEALLPAHGRTIAADREGVFDFRPGGREYGPQMFNPFQMNMVGVIVAVGNELVADEEPADTNRTEEWVLYVCPECGAWADGTGNGFPLYSACEHEGHPEAERVHVSRAALAVGQAVLAKIDADRGGKR